MSSIQRFRANVGNLVNSDDVAMRRARCTDDVEGNNLIKRSSFRKSRSHEWEIISSSILEATQLVLVFLFGASLDCTREKRKGRPRNNKVGEGRRIIKVTKGKGRVVNKVMRMIWERNKGLFLKMLLTPMRYRWRFLIDPARCHESIMLDCI